MQQRTYARSMGSGRTASSQEGDPLQQSPFAGLSMDRSNPPASFVNAPTSLTNLAQLSGISLLPINDRNSALSMSVNNSQVISLNGLQQPKVTVSASSRQNTASTSQQEMTSANNHPQYSTAAYNISTIPSIQLLNKTSIGHQLPSGVTLNAPRSGGTNKSKRQATTSNSAVTSHKRPRSQAYPDAATLPGYSNDMVQVLPVSESIGLNFIPKSARGMQSTGDATFQGSGQYSANSDNDSMSLVKLMAIFNNPALTITPVVTASTSATPSNLGASSWMNLNQSGQNTSKPLIKSQIPRQTSTKGKQQLLSEVTQSNEAAKKISDKKSLPKSTTNLNLFYAGSTKASRDTQESNSLDTQRQHVQSIEQELKFDQPDTITLTWTGKDATSDKTTNLSNNNPMCPCPAPITPPNIPQEFSATTETIGDLPRQHDVDSNDFKSEFIITRHRIDPKPLMNLAKCKDVTHSVSSETSIKKLDKSPIISTKRRLYVPRTEMSSSKRSKSSSWLNEIIVESIEQPEENYISDRHTILSRLDEIADSLCQKRSIAIEPDDIFVDRSKRIMSRIDTDMERKRKKKFEKISQRSPPVEQSDDLSDESEYEVQFSTEHSSINEFTVLPIQLPLDETIDDHKRDYMSSFGLVSRTDRNQIIAEQSERRLKVFSVANSRENCAGAEEDVQRIVNTLVQTGGGEVCMRTETDIKRNELPFLEGLNRNTSRIKITFMNALGLEKRSKRTTLYKVVKPQESISNNNQAQSDLSNKVQNLTPNHIVRPQQVLSNTGSKSGPPINSKPHPVPFESVKQNGVGSMSTSGGTAEILRKAMKLAQASCREALHRAPNKDEYMKSLGLMAS